MGGSGVVCRSWLGKGGRVGSQRTSTQKVAKGSLMAAERLVDRESLACLRHRLQLVQKRQVLAGILWPTPLLGR